MVGELPSRTIHNAYLLTPLPDCAATHRLNIGPWHFQRDSFVLRGCDGLRCRVETCDTEDGDSKHSRLEADGFCVMALGTFFFASFWLCNALCLLFLSSCISRESKRRAQPSDPGRTSAAA